jgi:thiol-disulfide isomerase/thioredoxin
VIVTFWGSGCGPCIGELRLLRDSADTLSRHGVEVVAIAMDIEPNIRSLIAAQRIGFPILVAGEGDVHPMSVFGQATVTRPFGVFLAPEQRVLETRSGSIEPSELLPLLDRLFPVPAR